MAYLVKDSTGEQMFKYKPQRNKYLKRWILGRVENEYNYLFKGSIKKLIGRNLYWKDSPVKIDEKLVEQYKNPINEPTIDTKTLRYYEKKYF